MSSQNDGEELRPVAHFGDSDGGSRYEKRFHRHIPLFIGP
jgi:hypothetical protein